MSAERPSADGGIRFLPAGDTALVVEFGNRIDRGLNERVLALGDRIRDAAIEGVTETVATFRSLLVHYDPLVTSTARLRATIGGLLDSAAPASGARRQVHIPACYDPACAPDLDDVAERMGLSREDVVAIHSGRQYHVYSIGFLPGYAYMGDVAPELSLPRRADPRVRVPPGSIAIAAGMTGIYPIESPGGWHLIGATAIRLFDTGWPSPTLFTPGDAVRFVPIGRDEYERQRSMAEPGPPRSEEIA
jgi:KipI family sensor histidine kinase inhibitor